MSSADNRSHVVGDTSPGLIDLTIGQALTNAARTWGSSQALVSVAENVRLTFSELNDRATELAAGLIALGMRRGDRLGIWSPNNASWTLIQFAAARAGLILVTINPAYRSTELEYSLRKLSVRALVALERFKGSDYVAMVEELAPEIEFSPPGSLSARHLPDLRLLIKIGGKPRRGWMQLTDVIERCGALERKSLATLQNLLSPDDPINVQFTSGTTGSPKGATLSHRNILNNAFFVGRAIGLIAGDRLCIPVPLYHCFGMVMGNLASLVHGAAMVYPAESFDANSTLNAIATERCTHLYGVPTMFIAILESAGFDTFDLSSLRGGCMAGAPCPIETMRKVIDRMHMRDITIAYGMTETSPVSFQTACHDAMNDRISTVGRVQPHLQCKVAGPDGAPLPRNETGELCTRGYSVMLGYWGEPERTAEAIDAEGWMHTGDLATIDESGLCRIVGRIKDMVIRGGENIYPREVEEFLRGVPGIEDAAVVGIPDEKYGEELCAWIRLRPGATTSCEDIVAFCNARVARHKIPRYLRVVDEFPMTVTGKVQKFIIRERMIQELRVSASGD